MIVPPPSQPLPTNIATGTIVGRFGVVGSADDGFAPMTGLIVTFDPAVGELLLDATALPVPLAIIMSPVVCSIDAEGYLCGPSGYRGVTLIATDDPDLSATGWTYGVRFSGTQNQFSDFSLSVASGSQVDIANLLPVAT